MTRLAPLLQPSSRTDAGRLEQGEGPVREHHEGVQGRSRRAGVLGRRACWAAPRAPGRLRRGWATSTPSWARPHAEAEVPVRQRVDGVQQRAPRRAERIRSPGGSRSTWCLPGAAPTAARRRTSSWHKVGLEQPRAAAIPTFDNGKYGMKDKFFELKKQINRGHGVVGQVAPGKWKFERNSPSILR